MKGYCYKCNVELSDNNASPSSIKSSSSLCRICDADYRRDKYLKRNPNAIPRLGNYKSREARTGRTVEQHRLRKFGITKQQFDDKIFSQDNCCEICKQVMDGSTRGKKACQDHNHRTGKLRDILCGRCNLLLGHVQERIEILASAIQYLQKHTDELKVSSDVGIA